MMIMITVAQIAYNTKKIIKNKALKFLKDVDEGMILTRMICG